MNPKMLWNNMTLKSPTEDFFIFDEQDDSQLYLARDLLKTLTCAVEKLTSDDTPYNEAKLIFALKNRLALRLPSDKFLHLYQRVCCCLRNYISLNLPKEYLHFSEAYIRSLPFARIPGKQHLEFILIRTQGVARLLCQILVYTEETFCHLLKQLNIGHMTQSLVLASAAIARVHVTYKAILFELCSIYDELFPYVEKLKPCSWQWPRNPELPCDLLEWIKPQLQSVSLSTESNKSFLKEIFSRTVEQTNMKKEEPNIEETKQDEIEFAVGKLNGNFTNNSIQSLDVGEVVKRKTTPLIPNATKKEKKSENSKKPKQKEDESSLHEIISEARTVKSLKYVWKTIHSDKQLAKKYRLTSKKVKCIDTVLENLMQTQQQLKENKIGKTSEIGSLLKTAKKTLVSKLGLQQITKTISSIPSGKRCASQKGSIKPVKTFSDFKDLFDTLNIHLNKRKSNKVLLGKLERIFSKGYGNAQLLSESSDIRLSKKLLFKASKQMISLCKLSK